MLDSFTDHTWLAQACIVTREPIGWLSPAHVSPIQPPVCSLPANLLGSSPILFTDFNTWCSTGLPLSSVLLPGSTATQLKCKLPPTSLAF
jgi:hypothetical protein